MDNKEELEEEKMNIKEAKADEVKETNKQEIITIEEAERIVAEDDVKRIKNLQVGAAIISVAAVTLVGSVGMLIAHNINAPKKHFTYKTDSEGKIQISGRVKYSEVKEHWKLLEKEGRNKKTKLYIVDETFFGYLINISTDKEIAVSTVQNSGRYSDPTVVNLENLEPYLFDYDMVYDSYTIEDIDRLLGLIEVDYEYSTLEDENKVMMKINE